MISDAVPVPAGAAGLLIAINGRNAELTPGTVTTGDCSTVEVDAGENSGDVTLSVALLELWLTSRTAGL